MAIPALSPYTIPPEASWPPSRARWRLERARAALLVHDMQEYFLRPYDAKAPPVPTLIGNVERLVTACRAFDVPVFFSLQPGEQDRDARGLLWDLWGPGIIEHPAAAALALDVGDAAPVDRIAKRRYSAFFETTLHERMRELGRDQLIITGIYAHIGCLATALDGFMRGIRPFFAADATADFSREDHEIALRQVARTCGVVVSTDRLARAIASGHDGAPPGAPVPDASDLPPAPLGLDDGESLEVTAVSAVPEGARHILDLGCGDGNDTLAIAEAHPEARVIGVDRKLEAVLEARRCARHAALDVRFGLGDARALAFADDSFDVVRLARLFEDAEDAMAVVREVARVTRPGGTVILHDREAVLAPAPAATSDDDERAVVPLLERMGFGSVTVVGVWPWRRGPESERGLSVTAIKAPLGAPP